MPRTRPFRFVLRATPQAVRDRLAARTELRLFPATSRALAFTDRPLAGRVAGDGSFNVAVNRRDLLQRLRPTARGRVVETAGGTVVEGVASLPPWMTWYLRVVWAAIAVAVVGLGGAALATAAGVVTLAAWGGLAGLLPGALAALAMLVATGLGIGWHVSSADAGVDALVAAVGEASGAGDVAAAEAVEPVAAAAEPVPRSGARSAGRTAN